MTPTTASPHVNHAHWGGVTFDNDGSHCVSCCCWQCVEVED